MKRYRINSAVHEEREDSMQRKGTLSRQNGSPTDSNLFGEMKNEIRNQPPTAQGKKPLILNANVKEKKRQHNVITACKNISKP